MTKQLITPWLFLPALAAMAVALPYARAHGESRCGFDCVFCSWAGLVFSPVVYRVTGMRYSVRRL